MSITASKVGSINLGDPSFWARPLDERYNAFAELRATPGMTFHEMPTLPGMPPSNGWYAAVRYTDVVDASLRPGEFSNGLGAIRTFDWPEPFWDVFGSIIAMDNPRHARLRRLVQQAFTPRILQRAEASIRRLASEIVDKVALAGECDLVADIASQLPLKVICEMMGIPDEEYGYVYEQSNMILGAEDPEYAAQVPDFAMALLGASHNLIALVDKMCDERERHPSDDLTSVMVHGEVDGEKLTRAEIARFFILLVVAGNETTRNAITHGVRYLTEFPEQRAVWLADIDGVTKTAVEEIVRYASPVIHMRRTMTAACDLGGQHLEAGDKVVLYYPSANRDATKINDPDRFDVRRDPNEHVAYGGPGPHYCLGAHLARRELSMMFRELLTRLPDIHTTAPPDLLLSDFVFGVKRQPCAFTPQS
jgi:methyl-branched lipid omega-hydroxylase